MELPFTIQIPVFNETRALEFSSFYFERLGWRPRYVLDSQRTPDAEATLRRLGHEAVFFENDKPFLENGYENFAAASPTDWILRLDCDEVPSPGLIEFCRDFAGRDEPGVAGFKRRQVVWQGDRFLAVALDQSGPLHQRQWRLFNRTRVRYQRHIHTPGFEREACTAAPLETAFYHLSWVFLTWEDRLRKSARYDEHGQSAACRAHELSRIEDASWETLDAKPLNDAFAEWLRRGGQGVFAPLVPLMK